MAHRSFISKVASVADSKMRRFFFEPRDRLRKTIVSRSREANADFPLGEFANYGYHIFRSFCNEAEINRLKFRYINQAVEEFESSDGNLSIPFFDMEFMKSFYESVAWKLLSMYGHLVYGGAPVLQIYPSVILTKPTFTQGEFSGQKHKVPAQFHTDYPTELTVHIPLTKIGTDTNHTRFCIKSHRSLKVRAQSSYSEAAANSFNHANLLADAGDLIVIDVNGIHRADVVQDSVRIMVQLKFSLPRYVLHSLDWSHVGKKAGESLAFTQNRQVFDEDLQSSLLFKNAQALDRRMVQSFMRHY